MTSEDLIQLSDVEPFDEDRLGRTMKIFRACLTLLGLSPSNSCVYPFPSTNASVRTATSMSQLSIDQSEKTYDPSVITFDDIELISYEPEHLEYIMSLMGQSLSEAYNIYVYRNFVDIWPDFTFVAKDRTRNKYVGAIVGRKDDESNSAYIAMLAVEQDYRKNGIGKALIKKIIEISQIYGCYFISLEAETINKGALRLYSHLGFIRQKVLPSYYINGNDAFHLKLFLHIPSEGGLDNVLDTMDWNQFARMSKKFEELYI